jgi:hypothetical protein
MPGCGGGHGRLHEAAVDHAIERPERPVFGDFNAAGGYIDTASFGHHDASGRRHCNASTAAVGSELDHAAPTAFGQQSAEVIGGGRAGARSVASDIPASAHVDAVNIGAVHA